jgi:hypothetical protein
VVSLAAAAVMLTAQTARSATLIQISSDPFTNSTSAHRTEVEPDTFSFGSTIVAAFQQGRFFNGGASDVGFSTSTDGGSTWIHGSLPGITSFAGGPYDRTSDATVAFDARHNVWMISSLGIHTAGLPPAPAAVDVVVNRSTDGGLSWSSPVVAATVPGKPSKPFLDKNWTACDNTPSSPFYGSCYTEFDDASLADRIFMTTSSDGGLEWSSPVAVRSNTRGIGGQPVVQHDGRVVVPIDGFNGHLFTLLSFISTDGGASWSNPSLVTKVSYHRPAGGIRAGIPLPSAEVDASGRVYVAWPDCRFEAGCAANDIVLSTSTDGVSWSPVSRVPADGVGTGVDHFIVGLGVDRATSGSSAHLGLAYYFYPNANCTPDTCQLDAGFISSQDGGSTWSASVQLAGPMSLSWLPPTSQGTMVGDYISTSFSGAGVAYPTIAVASAPTNGVFDEATFTAAE